MKLESITKSNVPGKKYAAVYCLCPGTQGGNCSKPQKKTVQFGQEGSQTYVEGATDAERANYIARHRANEHWNDATTAGALSRYILWGDSRSLEENIKSFKSKFNV